VAITTTNRWLVLIDTGFTKQTAYPTLTPRLTGFARIAQVVPCRPGGAVAPFALY